MYIPGYVGSTLAQRPVYSLYCAVVYDVRNLNNDVVIVGDMRYRSLVRVDVEYTFHRLRRRKSFRAFHKRLIDGNFKALFFKKLFKSIEMRFALRHKHSERIFARLRNEKYSLMLFRVKRKNVIKVFNKRNCLVADLVRDRPEFGTADFFKLSHGRNALALFLFVQVHTRLGCKYSVNGFVKPFGRDYSSSVSVAKIQPAKMTKCR